MECSIASQAIYQSTVKRQVNHAALERLQNKISDLTLEVWPGSPSSYSRPSAWFGVFFLPIAALDLPDSVPVTARANSGELLASFFPAVPPCLSIYMIVLDFAMTELLSICSYQRARGGRTKCVSCLVDIFLPRVGVFFRCSHDNG